MKRLIIGLVIALGMAVVLAAPSAASDQSCEPVAVFSTGGMNDPGASAFPDTRQVWYPASIWPLGDLTYDESVRQGRDNVVRAVDEFAAQCPTSDIRVVGYSQGARVAGDALEVLQTRPYAPRVTGKLFSDPKHPGGIEDTFQGISLAGITFTGPRRGFNVPVESVCNPYDGICDLPKPLYDPEGFLRGVHGYFTGAHSYYLEVF